ncbi:LysM peptidoglycan-binding domain-containing protein, partial [Escherichia coli]|nr:LysM peptidoglycan-binding domain-containing protein [Escherichia coli]
VKKGDTLYSISRKHNISVQELKNLNNIKDSNISVGQSIKIIN